MEELEFLKDLAKSTRLRLEELSNILIRVDDTTTRAALTNNHQKGMEELAKINARIMELEN